LLNHGRSLSVQAAVDFSRTRNETFCLPVCSQITGVGSMRDRIGIYPWPSGDEASGRRFRLPDMGPDRRHARKPTSIEKPPRRSIRRPIVSALDWMLPSKKAGLLSKFRSCRAPIPADRTWGDARSIRR
jgi:hypothetical protein